MPFFFGRGGVFWGYYWTTHRTGESEPRPTSGSTSGPTSPPTRAPTRADFPVFSPSRTPHETSHEGAHGRAHQWTVGVHLSCFHLFCSLTNYVGVQNFGPGGYLFGIFRGNSGSGHLRSLWQVGAFSILRHCYEKHRRWASKPAGHHAFENHYTHERRLFEPSKG